MTLLRKQAKSRYELKTNVHLRGTIYATIRMFMSSEITAYNWQVVNCGLFGRSSLLVAFTRTLAPCRIPGGILIPFFSVNMVIGGDWINKYHTFIICFLNKFHTRSDSVPIILNSIIEVLYSVTVCEYKNKRLCMFDFFGWVNTQSHLRTALSEERRSTL